MRTERKTAEGAEGNGEDAENDVARAFVPRPLRLRASAVIR